MTDWPESVRRWPRFCIALASCVRKASSSGRLPKMRFVLAGVTSVLDGGMRALWLAPRPRGVGIVVVPGTRPSKPLAAASSLSVCAVAGKVADPLSTVVDSSADDVRKPSSVPGCDCSAAA